MELTLRYIKFKVPSRCYIEMLRSDLELRSRPEVFLCQLLHVDDEKYHKIYYGNLKLEHRYMRKRKYQNENREQTRAGKYIHQEDWNPRRVEDHGDAHRRR